MSGSLRNKSFEKFTNFDKFSYRYISKPNQSLKESLSIFKILYFDWSQKAAFLRDVSSLVKGRDIPIPSKQRLNTYNKIYKCTDIAIGIYIISSFIWHYRKGYFHHSKSKLLDAYIVGKIVLNVFLIHAVSFYIFKRSIDPIMYEHFSKKEKEWDDKILGNVDEIEAIKQKVHIQDKIKNKNS